MKRAATGLLLFIIACTDEDIRPPARDTPLHKGMTLAAWDRAAYASDEARTDLDSLDALGVNAIAVIPTLCQDSLQSDSIYIHPQNTGRQHPPRPFTWNDRDGETARRRHRRSIQDLDQLLDCRI